MQRCAFASLSIAAAAAVKLPRSGLPISGAEGRIGSILGFIYILVRRVHISSSVVEEKNPMLKICMPCRWGAFRSNAAI